MFDINKVRSVVKLKDLLKDGLIRTGEPQKAYMFEVAIIDNVEGETFNNLKYYVKEVTIPTRSREPIVKEYMGNKLHWAGKESSNHEMNISFWDDEDLMMTHFINSWYQLGGDHHFNDGIEKAAYTRDIKVIMKPTLDIGSTGTFLFKGCFPTEIGEVALSYDDSNVMEFNTTFTFDYMEILDADENLLKSFVDLYGTVGGTIGGIDKIKGIF